MADKTAPTRHLSRKVVFGITFFVLIVVASVIAYGIWGPKQQPFGTPVIVNRVLLNGTITVDGSYYYIEFSVPKGAFNIQVSGTFSVTNQHSIRVLVTNNSNYASTEGINYDSHQSQSGTINATLTPGGTYYLVYDNSLQPFEKTINTQATLSYLHT